MNVAMVHPVDTAQALGTRADLLIQINQLIQIDQVITMAEAMADLGHRLIRVTEDTKRI